MIRFWGQDKYSQRELIGYELFLREYNDGQWRFPADFGKFTASEFAQTLVDTIGALPAGIQLVSINLDQPQFIDPQYIDQLGVAQRACPDTLIIVELTERPYNVPIAQLVTAAAAYQDLGLWVCLDDVGTGANQVDLVEALAPHVKEYKFALQNFHNKRDFVTVVSPQLQFWREEADINSVFFVIEGFETEADLKVAQNYHAEIVQGYYYGRPHMIQVKN
ncbi:EAL domain-containing protein [Lacticaseibacillus sharpeae]|uniref:C-di-GMP-specific phosphodiesterase n=1 Tax=Lacticaseibacillus sharpeae JCM 1186 = DSM 20505 TaxID=1291052 RepID=A0A0R1ZWX2_9LACO|nr:EAL domain-containing protein [Lacticaseibacillus sharpeae]KRM56294.1 C-di-GMP-specific phosphodiesterase [Lacticaseibacillus sharpeae JCM 1186 = DSM 20505]